MLSIGRPVPYNVVPAQAGVILVTLKKFISASGGPRTGGGDPFITVRYIDGGRWSPHRRG